MDVIYDIWEAIKKFIIFFVAEFLILILISVIRYWDFIKTAIANNIWTCLDAMMVPLLVLGAIVWMIVKVR